MKYSLLILALLTSCGKLPFDVVHPVDPRISLSTDPVFSPYTHDFESYLGHSIGDIPINFAVLKNKNSLAECWKWTNGDREIVVDKTFWNAMSTYEQRQQLIFHELGHCELNLDHEDSMYYFEDTYCPNSIMNMYGFSDYSVFYCYVPDFYHYRVNLFGK